MTDFIHFQMAECRSDMMFEHQQVISQIVGYPVTVVDMVSSDVNDVCVFNTPNGTFKLFSAVDSVVALFDYKSLIDALNAVDHHSLLG